MKKLFLQCLHRQRLPDELLVEGSSSPPSESREKCISWISLFFLVFFCIVTMLAVEEARLCSVLDPDRVSQAGQTRGGGPRPSSSMVTVNRTVLYTVPR